MDFGQELRDIPNYTEFTRALNARDMMSNSIPDMKEEHEFPYCIWYPEGNGRSGVIFEEIMKSPVKYVGDERS